MTDILIIDDDKNLCDMLNKRLHQMGHTTTCASNIEQGLKKLKSHLYDLLLLDVHLPDGNGLETIPKARQINSNLEVIILTGEGSADGAELALRNGAWDYIQKGVSMKEMILAIQRVVKYQVEKATRKTAIALRRENIIGNSRSILSCLDLMAQAAYSNSNVLIMGETGTGKEIFARGIHDNSNRVKENFIVVDCAALPETLAEVTLFGCKKGAYTGAGSDREGLIQIADKGTLFLDEIGELTLPLQKVFLRVIQERRFLPVGGKVEVESEFRMIAATNRDLEKMTREGTFRKDLFYRLRAISIRLPSLRDRKEDIKDITIHYMNKFCEKYQLGVKGISPEIFEIFNAYDWPGNIRELVNTMESAISASRESSIIYPKHLPIDLRIKATRNLMKNEEDKEKLLEVPSHLTFREFREKNIVEIEKRYLLSLMDLTGNIKNACAISGLSRARLYALLKKYNVSRQKRQ